MLITLRSNNYILHLVYFFKEKKKKNSKKQSALLQICLLWRWKAQSFWCFVLYQQWMGGLIGSNLTNAVMTLTNFLFHCLLDPPCMVLLRMSNTDSFYKKNPYLLVIFSWFRFHLFYDMLHSVSLPVILVHCQSFSL